MKSSLHGGYLKHWAILAISLLWGLNACAPATQFAPPPVFANIVTPSPVLTNTSTSITSTSIPTGTLTPSITPLPTISTFTPTFDARTVLTVTPAPKAECPQEDPSVVAKFATPNSDGSYEIYSPSDILDYLNSRGTPAQLRDSGLAEMVDLTGDAVNEVGYEGFFNSRFSILGCKYGKYQDFLDFTGDTRVWLADVVDLNKNGIPEIILYNVIHYGYVDISIFEWDGNKFLSLIDMGRDTPTDPAIDWVSATDYHKLIDTNGDGLKEMFIVFDVNQLCGGFGDFCDGTPARQQTTILGWNGQNYVDLKQESYAPPQYRFQAIQDGDWQTRYGNYARALPLYQEAIFNDELE